MGRPPFERELEGGDRALGKRGPDQTRVQGAQPASFAAGSVTASTDEWKGRHG